MKVLEILKRIPIDFGQGNLRKYTKGKLIALSLVPNVKNKIALDVGCGEGEQTKWLENKGYRVVSIDKYKFYPQCQLVDIDQGLPFNDNTFDLIWCSEVIEHLINPQNAIKEFLRVTRPDGVLILTTPNSYFWLMEILYLFGLKPKKIQNPGHKHFFRLKDIKQLFPKAKIFGFFPYCLFKFKITHMIGLLSPTFIIFHIKK